MNKIEELQREITSREHSLAVLRAALTEEQAKPENNVFESLNKAHNWLSDALLEKAFEDCEGAGNVGQSEYSQKFTVEQEIYTAVLTVEYNRHDKTYYYIDNSEFFILDANEEKVEY